MEVVKEAMVVGHVDEDVMEVMVNHCTTFFMENVVQSVQDEGGWDVLNVAHGDDMREIQSDGIRGIHDGDIREMHDGSIRENFADIQDMRGAIEDQEMIGGDREWFNAVTSQGDLGTSMTSSHWWIHLTVSLMSLGLGFVYGFRRNS